MTPQLFAYPRQTAFGRVLPKNKIYQHSSPGRKVKEHFVRQVEQIVWAHKLSPETLKLPATANVPEIQVFRVALKEPELHPDVLACMDKAIPFPILYELNHGGKVRVVAATKRPSEAEAGAWVVGEYGWSDWTAAETAPRAPLPTVLNLESLYRELLAPLMPVQPARNESLSDWSERIGELRKLEREGARLESRVQKERQFNRKAELHLEWQQIQKRLAKILGA